MCHKAAMTQTEQPNTRNENHPKEPNPQLCWRILITTWPACAEKLCGPKVGWRPPLSWRHSLSPTAHPLGCAQLLRLTGKAGFPEAQGVGARSLKQLYPLPSPRSRARCDAMPHTGSGFLTGWAGPGSWPTPPTVLREGRADPWKNCEVSKFGSWTSPPSLLCTFRTSHHTPSGIPLPSTSLKSAQQKLAFYSLVRIGLQLK